MRSSGAGIRLLLLCAAPVVVACDGDKPPPRTASGTTTAPESSRPAATPRKTSRAPLATAPPKTLLSPARCVVPMAKKPPTPARPAATCPPDPHGKPEMPRGYVTISDAPGSPRIPVELARTPEHRTHGLMHRTDMPPDEGMLFEWPEESQRSFWMKNTCLPLDMLFIAADGTIVGILEQVPTLNTKPRNVPCKSRYVLELHAGWARKHGIRSGQKLDIES